MRDLDLFEVFQVGNLNFISDRDDFNAFFIRHLERFDVKVVVFILRQHGQEVHVEPEQINY